MDEELIDDMRQETRLFVGAVIREDRSVLDFLDGNFTFLNGPLARHYGIPDVIGEEFGNYDYLLGCTTHCARNSQVRGDDSPERGMALRLSIS